MSIKKTTTILVSGLLLFACTPNQVSIPSSSTSQSTHDALGPVLVSSNGNNFYVWKYNGRIYVIGSAGMSQAFEKNYHLPYTRTILGAGPKGETVVFEVKKKQPDYTDRLVSRFDSTPFLIDSKGSRYFVWKYQSRIYVIGNEKTNKTFKVTHHLPYTKTILGFGPFGETVIFEINKKDPGFVDILKKRYQSS